MMANEPHCTTEQINALIDRTLSGNEKETVENHIAECAGCSQALSMIRRIDLSVKSLPIERVRGDFTREVLAVLHLAPKSPLLFRLLEKGAYLFGLFIVLGVMLTVFVASGLVDSREVSRGEIIFRQVMSDAGGMMSSVMAGLSGLLAQYLPFMFDKGNISIVAAVIVVLGVLALADKVLGRRFVHRAR